VNDPVYLDASDDFVARNEFGQDDVGAAAVFVGDGEGIRVQSALTQATGDGTLTFAMLGPAVASISGSSLAAFDEQNPPWD